MADTPQPQPPSVNALEYRMLSMLVSRMQLAGTMGLTFDGKRDLYAALGYAKQLTVMDFRIKYARNAIAARVLEAMARATWRGGAEIIEDEDPETLTPLEKAVGLLAKRTGMWSVLLRTDILAGLGHYAGLLIGAPGELQSELVKMSKQEDVLYLQPYAEDELEILDFDADPLSVRFGMPKMYTLKRSPSLLLGAAAITSRAQPLPARTVHWSRIIHFADGVLDDRVFGSPRLERVYNLLDDLEKVTGGGAEAFWLQVRQGMQFNLDKDAIVSPEDVTDMQNQIDEYMHNMRRAFRTKGVNVEMLGSQTSDFGPAATAIIEQIAAGSGIPQRILTGSEQGELASSQDRSNWGDRIADRRQEVAERLVRPLIDRLIEYGALPPMSEEDYDILWPKQEELTESEKSAVLSAYASANAAMMTATGEVLMTAAEMRDKFLHLDPLDEDEKPVAPGIQMQQAQLDASKESEAMARDDAKAEADKAAEDEGPDKAALNRAASKLVRRVDAQSIDVAVDAMKRSLPTLDAEQLRRALTAKDHSTATALLVDAMKAPRTR
jgi:hypothetical protein